MSPQKNNTKSDSETLGETLVSANRRRRSVKTYQQVPQHERAPLLMSFGYSPDEARAIAEVSKYLSAYNFNGHFFDWSGR
jgi:hypothetical protein